MRDLVKEFLRADRPWIAITTGLFLYTLYDVYKHISVPDSSFRQNAFMWLLFSLVSLGTIIVVMFLVTRVLGKLFKGFEVVKEVLGLLTAVFFHVEVSGPFYNQVFWGEEGLYFKLELVPVLIICGIYLFFRFIVFNGVTYFFKRRKRTNV